MKKKAQKRLMDTLALLAFAMQAAEFGIKLWDSIQQRKSSPSDKSAIPDKSAIKDKSTAKK